MTPLDRWAFALGNFILAFGILDLHVFEFLQANLPPDKFTKAKEEPFKVRLEGVRVILSESPEKEDSFRKLLSRIEPLRELRNHIAHGHLFVQISAKGEKPEITIARSKDQDDASVYGNQLLRLDDLLTASTTIADLCDEFCGLVGLYTTRKTVVSRQPPPS